MCAVEGELNIDKYEEKYYTKVNCNRVVFLGSNSDKKTEKVEDDDLDDDDFQVPFQNTKVGSNTKPLLPATNRQKQAKNCLQQKWRCNMSLEEGIKELEKDNRG